MIRHEGDEWILYTRDGSRVLGRHKSKKDAEHQEEVIARMQAQREARLDPDQEAFAANDGAQEDIKKAKTVAQLEKAYVKWQKVFDAHPDYAEYIPDEQHWTQLYWERTDELKKPRKRESLVEAYREAKKPITPEQEEQVELALEVIEVLMRDPYQKTNPSRAEAIATLLKANKSWGWRPNDDGWGYDKALETKILAYAKNPPDVEDAIENPAELIYGRGGILMGLPSDWSHPRSKEVNEIVHRRYPTSSREDYVKQQSEYQRAIKLAKEIRAEVLARGNR